VGPELAEVDQEDRHRAAVALLAKGATRFRITARRFSLCRDDADDALQRATEILLTKGPAVEPSRLAAWMQVVVRREALAIRRLRERMLVDATHGGGSAMAEHADPMDRLACEAAGPAEALERRERVAAAARMLALLKPQERRAIALQAQGYSYAEICSITGWTYTKVNRCLAEGRARLRELGVLDLSIGN
jgi:RNA polymerase sigma factor (sigma-70 family)